MRTGVLASVVFLAIAPLPVRAQAVPSTVFAREPAYGVVRLSPDGEHLGFIGGLGEQGTYHVLFFLDLATGKTSVAEAHKPHLVLEDGESSEEIKDFQWLNNDRVVVTLD